MSTSVKGAKGKLRNQTIHQLDTKESAKKLARETVCAELHLGCPGFKKTIDSTSIQQTDVDAAALTIIKAVINPKELKQINRCNDRLRRFIRSRAVPCDFFRAAIYVIPKDLRLEVEDAIQAYAEEMQRLLDNVEARYELIKDERRAALRSQFDESDYPPFDEVRALYDHDYRVFTLNFAAAIEELNAEITQRETRKVQSRLEALEQQQAQKIAANLESAAVACRSALREEFLKVVKTITERLDVQDGKAKTFKDSLVPNALDFLRVANFRDFTGDVEMQAMVSRLMQRIENVSSQDLRDDMDLRAAIRAEFATVEQNLDSMVKDAGGRKFIKRDK